MIQMVGIDSGGGGSGMSMEFGGGAQSKVRSGPEGYFEVRFLDAGEYTVSVMGSGFQSGPVAQDVVSLDKGESRNVDLTTKG